MCMRLCGSVEIVEASFVKGNDSVGDTAAGRTVTGTWARTADASKLVWVTSIVALSRLTRGIISDIHSKQLVSRGAAPSEDCRSEDGEDGRSKL
jgi:hypothetical protein